jgi:hypothetical protein
MSLKEENIKTNELGFQVVATILSPRRNYPYYMKVRYTPRKGTLGILVVAPSDGCPATAPCFIMGTWVPDLPSGGDSY